MKIKIDKAELLRGIQVTGNIITAKNMLPILANTLFETTKNKVCLTSTDLDIGISITLDAEVLEPGSITLPTKRLGEMIKEFPAGIISLTTKKNNIVDIQLKNCEFKLMGLPSDEFPKLPELKDKNTLIFEQDVLKYLLLATAFAVSREETRYVLNGLLLDIRAGQDGDMAVVNFVGTDGRRLAAVKKNIPFKINQDIKIIIPHKTIQELVRNLKTEGNISLVIGHNQVFFELGGMVIISRLIEGDFPDYQKVIPAVSNTRIKLNKDDFILVLRRASLLTTLDFQAVKFELFKNKLVLSKTTPDIGEFREEIPVEYGGKELVISFNPNYFLEMLKNWQEPEFGLELYDTEKPGVVRGQEYVYILQPMRMA